MFVIKDIYCIHNSCNILESGCPKENDGLSKEKTSNKENGHFDKGQSKDFYTFYAAEPIFNFLLASKKSPYPGI